MICPINKINLINFNRYLIASDQLPPDIQANPEGSFEAVSIPLSTITDLSRNIAVRFAKGDTLKEEMTIRIVDGGAEEEVVGEEYGETDTIDGNRDTSLTTCNYRTTTCTLDRYHHAENPQQLATLIARAVQSSLNELQGEEAIQVADLRITALIRDNRITSITIMALNTTPSGQAMPAGLPVCRNICPITTSPDLPRGMVNFLARYENGQITITPSTIHYTDERE